jgi:hypothetical protein
MQQVRMTSIISAIRAPEISGKYMIQVHAGQLQRKGKSVNPLIRK